MDTMQIQLKVWTTRPGELLRAVVCQHNLVAVDHLVKQSRFNGLFVIFRLSEEQTRVLESAASHLKLRHERCQLDHLYSTRWYSSSDPRERGTHDAEIDLWHVKTVDYPRCYTLFDTQNVWSVQENSPEEAITTLVFRIQYALDELDKLPERQRSQDVSHILAHHEGYLQHVFQNLPHLWPQIMCTEQKDGTPEEGL